MLDDIELSELLSVKLCHDLAGPVGAVNNGIELLKEGGDGIYEQAVGLAEMSAKNAVSRVLFYRQAYGAINREAPANIHSIKEKSENFFEGTKVEVEWNESFDGAKDITGDMGKLILNVLLLVSSSMIYGGKVEVGASKKSIILSGEGRSIKLEPDAEAMVSGRFDKGFKIDVKNVQSYYVYRLMQKMNIKSDVSVGDSKIEVLLK